MKFIVDAHLPLSLKKWLNENGQDAIHTRDLPKKNLTEDTEIIQVAGIERRIIVSVPAQKPSVPTITPENHKYPPTKLRLQMKVPP